jgi:hypothetical protein
MLNFRTDMLSIPIAARSSRHRHIRTGAASRKRCCAKANDFVQGCQLRRQLAIAKQIGGQSGHAETDRSPSQSRVLPVKTRLRLKGMRQEQDFRFSEEPAGQVQGCR